MADSEWWYEAEGQRCGPVGLSQLAQLLVSDRISADTKCWRKGMDGWTKMSEVPELAEVLKDCPPPLDKERPAEEPSPTMDADSPMLPPSFVAHPLAGPWSRFFARHIDLFLFAQLASIIVLVAYPPAALWPVATDPFLGSLIMLPIVLLIEVPVMALTGSTLGKALFGITVRQLDGSRLSMGMLLRRNVALWRFGFALGIPLVNAFFMARGHRLAKESKRSPWDEGPMHNVRQKPIGPVRFAVGAAVSFLLLGTMTLLDRMGDHPLSPTAPRIAWVNPLTKASVTLSSGWRDAPERLNDAKDVFLFESLTSAIVFGREVTRWDPLTYLGALRASLDLNEVEDQKTEVGADGVTYYLVTSRKAFNSQMMRVDLKVWRSAPGQYWRTVVFSPLDNESERAKARGLAGELAKTSLVEVADGK